MKGEVVGEVLRKMVVGLFQLLDFDNERCFEVEV